MASPAVVWRSWADLPPDILRSIVERLDLISCIRSQSVCSAWAAAISGARATHPPFLLFPDYKLFDVSNSEYYQIHVRNPSLTSCRSLIRRWVGSRDSWLVIEDSFYLLYLLSPFSGAQILLPSEFYGRSLSKVIICYTPNHNTGFLLLAVLCSGSLAVLRAGDEGWSLLGKNEIFKDAIFCDGKVYALTNQNHLCSCDLSTSSPKFEIVSYETIQTKKIVSFVKRKIVSYYPDMHKRFEMVESERRQIMSANEERYLVESGEKILMVIRERVSYSLENSKTSTEEEDTVRVLKFDPVRAEWSHVHSLDSFALFLGGTTGCYSVPVSDHNSHGFRGSCIYFIDNTSSRILEEGKWVHSFVEEFNLNLREGMCRVYRNNYEIVTSPSPIWLRLRPTLF